MKETKIEIPLEREIQPRKALPNQPELIGKSELELKYTKEDELRIEEDTKNNCFLEHKNKPERDSDYKSKKGNRKNNNKINIINIKRNTYLIITMIFVTLITSNNNMINNGFSNITLIIRGPGFRNIFYYEFINNKNRPNAIYINGNQNTTITYKYYFNETNNTVNILWNHSFDNCGNMFRECSDIIEIDLSNFDTSIVTDMNSMFSGCSKLSSLNLFNFDTSNVKYMNSMFFECRELSFINLSNFNSSKVEDMNNMFYFCSKLSSINLSNFDTSKVTNMNSMFCGCSLLSSLNLSNFITSKVTSMRYMFSSCSKLSSLNLSNFDTSLVTDMNFMFQICSLISSLNLSNFDTSKVTKMEMMFSSCYKLEYINLNNFIENDSLNTYDMFSSVPENIVVCLNENSNKIKENLMRKMCYTINCSDDWKINQKNLVINIR